MDFFDLQRKCYIEFPTNKKAISYRNQQFYLCMFNEFLMNSTKMETWDGCFRTITSFEVAFLIEDLVLRLGSDGPLSLMVCQHTGRASRTNELAHYYSVLSKYADFEDGFFLFDLKTQKPSLNGVSGLVNVLSVRLKMPKLACELEGMLSEGIDGTLKFFFREILRTSGKIENGFEKLFGFKRKKFGSFVVTNETTPETHLIKISRGEKLVGFLLSADNKLKILEAYMGCKDVLEATTFLKEFHAVLLEYRLSGLMKAFRKHFPA